MANFANGSNFGDPSRPGWTAENLTTVRASNGQTWQVDKRAADAFSAMIADLAAQGYDLKSSGGYNYRNIRGSDKLSQHAYGNAIDINAAANPLGGSANDLPANIGEIAAKYGIEWGGNWKGRPDPMHFEWTGQGANLPQQQTAQNPQNPLGQPLQQRPQQNQLAQAPQQSQQPFMLNAADFMNRRNPLAARFV